MRFLTTLITCAALTAPMAAHADPNDGRVVAVEKIVDNGPASERFNLVLLAEGYREGELAAFAFDSQAFVDQLLGSPPFATMAHAFNVWRVDVASNESGADDPAACGGTGAVVDTYFDAHFCTSGIRRLLVVNNATAFDVLASSVPEWDQALILVNSAVYGGSGGTLAVTSLGSSWKQVALHEMGHSAYGLADEYEYWAGCGSGETDRDHHPLYEPVQPNVTIETNPVLLKWRDLLTPGFALPTTQNGNCSICDPQPDPWAGNGVVGLYEGAHYYHCEAFRPSYRCMMRDLTGFCPVCSQRITDVMASFLPPECSNGLDDDGDGLVDLAGGDPGCESAEDDSELSATLPCDDGLDNDGDGWVDFAGGDPGCRNPGYVLENPACQDGIDNDGQPGTDFDGGRSAGVDDPAGPDPYCSAPWIGRESPPSCGLIGLEPLLALPFARAMLRRRRRIGERE